MNYFIHIKFLIYKKSNFLYIKNLRDFMQEFDSYNYMNNYNEIDRKRNKISITHNEIINCNLLNNNLDELGFYLAGLIESDGSIIVPKENSNNTPNITISFHQDDKSLAEKICSILGYGFLELIPLRKAVKIHIRGKYSILKLLTLVNGKFRTPKLEKLNNLINYINNN
jgi:LAGLIDADG endonuclease